MPPLVAVPAVSVPRVRTSVLVVGFQVMVEFANVAGGGLPFGRKARLMVSVPRCSVPPHDVEGTLVVSRVVLPLAVAMVAVTPVSV